MEANAFANWGKPLLRYLIAKVIQYEPSTATSLLQVDSTFHQAAAQCLYEEIYIHDKDFDLKYPPVNTRFAAIAHHPHRYSQYVRTLVVVPAKLALQKKEATSTSSPSVITDEDIKSIQPNSLALLSKSLPHLEAFIWATDRMPFESICSVLNQSCPQLSQLLIRPTISDLAHSQHRLASQESCYGSTPIPQRWDAFMLFTLNNLETLYISGLSSDGIRELQKFLSQSSRLAVLTIDSQFVDDILLHQIAGLKRLKQLLIKTSGTKMTEKGVMAILEDCDLLQSLTLTEVEGRLNKSMWSRLPSLPQTFHTLRLAFNEEGPHRSWVTEHLAYVFDVLELAPNGLKTFSIIRLTPKAELIPVTCHVQEGMVLNNGNGESAQAKGLKRFFSNACDEVIRPRPFSESALSKIVQFGYNLEVLELDMFIMSIDELKSVLDSCKKLRYLRILIDAPLCKVLTMSSAFVALTCLHTLVLSITDAHCPAQSLISNSPQTSSKGIALNSTSLSPISRRQSVSTKSVSLASHQTPLAQSEPEKVSPTSSPRQSVVHRRRASIGVSTNLANPMHGDNKDITTASQQGIQGSVGSFDTSIPPKRDIRKFARRCPSLRILQWIGRNGKGEWRIAAGTSSLHTHIDFAPIHLVENECSKQLTLGCGADVKDFIHRKRIANSAHPGKRISIEEIDALPSGLVAAEDRQAIITKPRLDGRLIPRLRKSGVSQDIVEIVSLSKSDPKEPAKENDESLEQPEQNQSLKVRTTKATSVVLESDVKPAVSSNSTRLKTVNSSYADISDPTIVTRFSGEKAGVGTKMTILGESNRKRSSNNGNEVSSLSLEPATLTPKSPIKNRTALKGLERDEVFKTTNGQGKEIISTSGAAGRRNKMKKASSLEAVEATLISTSESVNRRQSKNR